ncbi:MAG: cytochrome c5 family protein [Proteobacteria bacterium]|nr:MAG: cytochrome c5 family protein [Pseudomonadota bacterium]
MKSAATILGASLVASLFVVSSAVLADGEADYKTACFACHDMGVAGAPKLGDTENWAPRIEQGADTLYKHAIEGYQGQAGYMPPRGGTTLDDDTIKAVVDYMVAQSS